MAPVARPPKVSWESLRSKLAREWQPGEHITVVGPTGSGKTHIAVSLAELCKYVLVLAAKRQDPLVQDLEKHGYKITRSLDEVLWTQTKDGRPAEPIHPKLVYWPGSPEKLNPKQLITVHNRQFGDALDWADKSGRWCLVVDETMYLADHLRLSKELDHLWFQGRTQKVSVVACAQRPSRVPRLAFSSATYLFLAQTNDSGDLERLREIAAGFPKGMIDEAVQSLDYDAHEFLFIDTRGKGLARVIAPPR
jgi:energy-coupling factor transporter ATP-binding protein EcfA2